MSSISFDPNYQYVDLSGSTPADAPVVTGTTPTVLVVDTMDDGLPLTGLGAGTSSALTGNPGDIDGVAATTSDDYSAWQEQLAILANENYPNPDAMLALAEAHGVPVQTAVQDIVDALGVSAAAENSGFVQDRIADLLVNSESLSREQVVSQLSTLSFLANRSDLMFAPMGGNRELMVQRNHLQAFQQAAFGNRFDAAAREALETKFQLDMAQARALDALESSVRNSARSYGAVSSEEAASIVDQCVSTVGQGEQQGFVSAAEIQAIVAGVSRRPADERTEALAVIAQEMLARQAAGTLSIDPAFQAAVQGAAGS